MPAASRSRASARSAACDGEDPRRGEPAVRGLPLGDAPRVRRCVPRAPLRPLGLRTGLAGLSARERGVDRAGLRRCAKAHAWLRRSVSDMLRWQPVVGSLNRISADCSCHQNGSPSRSSARTQTSPRSSPRSDSAQESKLRPVSAPAGAASAMVGASFVRLPVGSFVRHRKDCKAATVNESSRPARRLEYRYSCYPPPRESATHGKKIYFSPFSLGWRIPVSGG